MYYESFANLKDGVAPAEAEVRKSSKMAGCPACAGLCAFRSLSVMRKIKSKTIHEEVAAQIREMIRDGDLAKGQKIDEKYLCESMGVSRTPVRESLKMLNAEGLVKLIPNKGAYISDPPMEVIQDLFEVMSVLEGTAARLAVQKMTDKDFSKIEALQHEIEHYYDIRDHKSYLHRNNIQHAFIQDVAGNKVLKQVIEGLKQKVLIHRHRQLYEEDRFNQSIQEHRDIVEAFRKRDAGSAEAAMRRHLMNQCNALVAKFMSDKDAKGATG
jgi:DNA-binding GntR family transcriptional regulator